MLSVHFLPKSISSPSFHALCKYKNFTTSKSCILCNLSLPMEKKMRKNYWEYQLQKVCFINCSLPKTCIHDSVTVSCLPHFFFSICWVSCSDFSNSTYGNCVNNAAEVHAPSHSPVTLWAATEKSGGIKGSALFGLFHHFFLNCQNKCCKCGLFKNDCSPA